MDYEKKYNEALDFKTKLAAYLQNNSPKDGQYVISSESILEMAKEELIKRGELKEQKPAWSEEDEKIRRNLMSLLADMRGDRITEETYQKYYPWLSALRPGWKPTEEQMRELNLVTITSPELNDLYEQLKKLM